MSCRAPAGMAPHSRPYPSPYVYVYVIRHRYCTQSSRDSRHHYAFVPPARRRPATTPVLNSPHTFIPSSYHPVTPHNCPILTTPQSHTSVTNVLCTAISISAPKPPSFKSSNVLHHKEEPPGAPSRMPLQLYMPHIQHCPTNMPIPQHAFHTCALCLRRHLSATILLQFEFAIT